MSDSGPRIFHRIDSAVTLGVTGGCRDPQLQGRPGVCALPRHGGPRIFAARLLPKQPRGPLKPAPRPASGTGIALRERRPDAVANHAMAYLRCPPTAIPCRPPPPPPPTPTALRHGGRAAAVHPAAVQLSGSGSCPSAAIRPAVASCRPTAKAAAQQCGHATKPLPPRGPSSAGRPRTEPPAAGPASLAQLIGAHGPRGRAPRLSAAVSQPPAAPQRHGSARRSCSGALPSPAACRAASAASGRA